MAERPHTLADFQQQFAGYLLQRDLRPPELLARWLPAAHGVDPGESRRTLSGLRVYRNNVMHSLTQALAAQFPVVQRLVGAEFFGALARDYVRQEPPLDASLTYYGHLFADFVAAHPACHALPYLADVATLELACQRALHAADDAVLDLRELGAVPQERLGILRLFLTASARLLASPYPVDRIWAANVAGSDEEIRLDAEGACQMLVHRRGLDVQVVSLQPPAFALLQHLQRGTRLQDAWNLLEQSHAVTAADLPALLAYLFELQVFRSNAFNLAGDEA